MGILIHETLGLDTKIIFLLQLEQKLWHINDIKCKIGGHLGFFVMFFVLLHTW